MSFIWESKVVNQPTEVWTFRKSKIDMMVAVRQRLFTGASVGGGYSNFKCFIYPFPDFEANHPDRINFNHCSPLAPFPILLPTSIN